MKRLIKYTDWSEEITSSLEETRNVILYWKKKIDSMEKIEDEPIKMSVEVEEQSPIVQEVNERLNKQFAETMEERLMQIHWWLIQENEDLKRKNNILYRTNRNLTWTAILFFILFRISWFLLCSMKKYE